MDILSLLFFAVFGLQGLLLILIGITILIHVIKIVEILGNTEIVKIIEQD